MSQIEFDMQTSLSPEKVFAMLTDFSPRRPEIWPGLWEDAYKVYSVSDTGAEVREGSKSPKVWARERYDWSRPGVVRWEVLESNFCAPGSFVEVRVAAGDAGGSNVHVVWSRTPTSFQARMIFLLIVASRGAPVKASIHAAFKKASG